jgi:chemotaxis protein CheD
MKSHRFFDRQRQVWVRRSLPGEYASSPQVEETLMTVLGSCVSVCLIDAQAGLAGMNHFMLPQAMHTAFIDQTSTDATNSSARYGSYAMEVLINDLLSHGAQRERLRAWVFGGAKILRNGSDIGESNIQYASHYLQREKIRVVSQDTGGHLARKIYLNTHMLAPECELIETRLNRVQHREARYSENLGKLARTHESDVSLFNAV